METISESYRKLNQELHSEHPEYGANGHRNAPLVRQIADLYHAETILDYGCGKGTLGAFLRKQGYKTKDYDPAISGKDSEPDVADVVYCGDVAEHIEPEFVDRFLDDLKRVTGKAIIVTVATRAAKKMLADGRNAHLIQEPLEWWLPKLKQRFEMNKVIADSGEFTFFGESK